MKILIVTNLFPTPYDSERGIFTHQLVKRMMDLCQVTVVCPLPWFPRWKLLRGIKNYAQFSNTPGHYTIDGIQVHSPKYPLLPKLSEKYHAHFMAFGIKKYILQLHKDIGFTAVNSQWLYPDSVAVGLVLKNLPIPHIATGLGCDINHDIYEPGKGRKILDTLAICEAITVVSAGLKKELVSHNIAGHKITVIPNGIDTEQFKILDSQYCRDKLGIDTDRPIILYVGRLSEEKSVSTLIKATSALIQGGYNIRLLIVGEGPLENELTALTSKLGVSSFVSFIGKVEHSQVTLWMGAADYFCLPSIREGCPNVILEALASGRPVIASRVGAIPDIVTDDSGVLFTPEDVEDLTLSLKRAFATEWSPIKIKESVKNLSWELAAAEYVKIFRQSRIKRPSS